MMNQALKPYEPLLLGILRIVAALAAVPVYCAGAVASRAAPVRFPARISRWRALRAT